MQRRLGVGAECDLLDDVDAGVYTLAAFGDDLSEAAALVRRYSDPGIGLTDASVVVLAGKYRTVNLLKGQACLRSSALAKRYGWGFHFDEQGPRQRGWNGVRRVPPTRQRRRPPPTQGHEVVP